MLLHAVKIAILCTIFVSALIIPSSEVKGQVPENGGEEWVTLRYYAPFIFENIVAYHPPMPLKRPKPSFSREAILLEPADYRSSTCDLPVGYRIAVGSSSDEGHFRFSSVTFQINWGWGPEGIQTPRLRELFRVQLSWNPLTSKVRFYFGARPTSPNGFLPPERAQRPDDVIAREQIDFRNAVKGILSEPVRNILKRKVPYWPSFLK